MKTGIYVTCSTCHRQKKPIGRSAPLGSYMCEPTDFMSFVDPLSSTYLFGGCKGYSQEPRVGWLWPGETEEQFGYPCPDDGTRDIEIQQDLWDGYMESVGL